MPAKRAGRAPRAPRFWVASERDIRAGRTTDTYFLRTVEALRRGGRSHVDTVADVTAGAFPRGWPWACFTGLEEAAALLEGRPLDAWALPEGTLFPALDQEGVRVPAMVLRGPYADYAALETPLLGLLCQATGVATQAARFKALAGEAQLLSFGVRRMHPAIAPMIDRAAFLGGCDAVSCVLSAEMLGVEARGTMPHALMIAMGSLEKAWKAYDAAVDRRVPRIVLVDTYLDEKAETLLAAEVLGKRLHGVRLDTPASRRGDLAAIVREVRWELALRGRGDVEVYVSGGIREDDVSGLRAAGAVGFGVGTSISNARAVDFALDLVEVEGQPVAKRGKFGGHKMVWRCPACGGYRCTPFAAGEAACGRCGAPMERALQPLLKAGRLAKPLPAADAVRRRVLRQLAALPRGWDVVPLPPSSS